LHQPVLENAIVHSFVEALSVVFITASAIMVIAFVLSLFLKQVELRSAGGPKKDGDADDEAAFEAPAPALH